MNTIRWVYPESLDELRAHLSEGARLHGGGTGIMRRPPTKGTLVDLSRVGIDVCSTAEAAFRFGGASSITQIVDLVAASDPDHILVRSLGRMAAPALRNRITIGGSIALAPPWTSVVGPLLALEARVTLAGSHEGTVNLAEYLERAALRRRSAVIEIAAQRQPGWSGYWFTFARARFNYPLFSVTVIGDGGDGRIADHRIVITGNLGRYRRLVELEARLTGGPPPRELTRDDLGTRIPDRQGFDGSYLTHVAAVEIRRGLEYIAGGGA